MDILSTIGGEYFLTKWVTLWRKMYESLRYSGLPTMIRTSYISRRMNDVRFIICAVVVGYDVRDIRCYMLFVYAWGDPPIE